VSQSLVARRRRRSRSYHEWVSDTPVIDAVRSIVGVASVVIGGHAAIFLAVAIRDDDEWATLVNVLLFVAIAVANASLDALRHWRRHHA
jgi:uroporphyrinogen-III decarboxylase